MTSVKPMLTAPTASLFADAGRRERVHGLAELTHEQRIEAFSNKRSTFNLAEAQSSGGDQFRGGSQPEP